MGGGGDEARERNCSWIFQFALGATSWVAYLAPYAHVEVVVASLVVNLFCLWVIVRYDEVEFR